MKKKSRINDQIIATTVHAISESGEQLGEIPLSQALSKAQDAGMDLVEVGGRDGVPVVKMMDYGKQQFRKKKNQQKSKTTKVELKTLRISYKISEHDLDVRRKQAEKFAKQGHLLRIELLLRGRERQFEQVAKQKMESFVTSLEEIYTIHTSLKVTGNKLFVQLNPKK